VEVDLVDFVARRRLIASLVGLGGLASLGVTRNVSAADAAPAHDAHEAHDHSAHKAQMAQMAKADKPAIQRVSANYQVPAVPMIDQRGRTVAFDKAIDDGRVVMLNFIFTTCTTICPVLTQVFLQVQTKLASQLDKIHMVSVSIDPEYDTPKRLLAYSQQHGAGAQWDFYTGSNDASIAVQKALDAYRGGKMNHEAVTLLRKPRSGQWLRLNGFATPDSIVDAYRSIAG
jgi:protein SCO1/2